MRVMVVDDDRLVAKALSRCLGRAGFEVRVADSGAAALSLLGEFQPAVVLCDFRMPGESGTAVLIEFKKRSPSTMRIMVSGYADATATADFQDAEIFEFVSKPWDSAELISCVHRAMARRAEPSP
jgi:DNA-binding NtrC family response regulator